MIPSPEEVFGAARIEALHALHQNTLAPNLAALDEERVALVRHHRLLWAVSAAITIPSLVYCIYVIGFVPPETINEVTLFTAIMVFSAGVLVLVGTAWPPELTRAAKRELIAPLITGLGYDYTTSPHRIGAPLKANELGLLKKHDIIATDEYIAGTRSGIRFEMLETELQKRRHNDGNVEYVRVFWGQCFAIDFDKAFHGVTVATRRSDLTSFRRRPPGLKRLKLEAKGLASVFRMASSDQVEARYLLTPDVLERLINLEKRLNGKKLRFGFKANVLFIVIEKGNLFDPRPRKHAYASQTALDKILQDMAAIAALFDTLAATHKREQAGGI